MTTPVVRCLKKQYPSYQMHYVTKQANAGLLLNNPYIDKLFLLKDSLKELIAELKKEDYSFIIDLHNNLRSRRLCFSLGVKSTHFNKLNIEKWLLVNFKINKLPPLHIVDRYMQTLKDFNVSNDGEGLDYYADTNVELSDTLLPQEGVFIAWAIGGKHNTKIFPPHKVRSVCQKLDTTVVLLGDKNDRERGQEIASGLPHVVNGCGLFSLDASAKIVEKAALVISNDTGLMHIAAAFRKPLISIWGNTVTAFGMYPYLPVGYQKLSEIIEVKDLKCRPCSKIGFRKCPKTHFKCMEAIEDDTILKAVNKLMNNTA